MIYILLILKSGKCHSNANSYRFQFFSFHYFYILLYLIRMYKSRNCRHFIHVTMYWRRQCLSTSHVTNLSKRALTTICTSQKRALSTSFPNNTSTWENSRTPTLIANNSNDMDDIQPVSAIERQLLKLAREQRDVYQKIRPAPGFVRTSSSRGRLLDTTTTTSNRLPVTGKVVLPRLGVLRNKRLRQLDRLKTIIARIHVSENGVVLCNLMQQFFNDCAQADASLQASNLAENQNNNNTTTTDTDTDIANNDNNNNNSDTANDHHDDIVERADWDQILEAGIRTASRLGNLPLAEAFMEQTKRMGLSIYVQLATHRVYRAIIEATWSHTKDACRVAHWVNEMNRTGIMLDIDTTLLIQKWAVTNIAEPSFVRSNEEKKDDVDVDVDGHWRALPGFERHATSSSDTLGRLVQQQRQTSRQNIH
ncbi:hypothetical protein BDF22DRAFT_91904 [Syncephalis plumigaleata]|nr:hypothetical protein BDF22DRAFT_91904 [Syncephalis plumigaleata]